MTDPEALTQIRERYVRLREVQRSLNADLFPEVGKAALRDCARALGFFVDGELVLDEEEDFALLTDFALHQHKDVRAAITRRLRRAGISEDERVVLNAMLGSRFTLFVVTDIEPDVGARVLDLFGAGPFLLADVKLAETGGAGMMIAAHVLTFETFVMTSGYPLPVDSDLGRQLVATMRTQFFSPADVAALPAHSRAQLAANMIGLARKRPAVVLPVLEASARGRGILPWAPPSAMMTGGPEKVGRNDPCSCGSGRKFKKCCAGKEDGAAG